MVQTKIIFALTALLLCCSCAQKPSSHSFGWEKYEMDAHRTGVKAARNGSVEETLGNIHDSVYTAPNGRSFGGSTFKAARDILAVQDKMQPLRAVVGTSLKGMKLDEPESTLSNWVVDGYIRIVEKKTGMHVDLSLANFGGIRCNMPEGKIILDDIMSMFPFNNHFCVVRLKGSRIWEIFDKIAQSGKVQPAGGIRMVFENGRLAKADIGGEPLQMDRIYNLATIDFLLDGGDGIFAADGAEELVNTGYLVRDGFLDYLSDLKAEGRTVDARTDGRMTILCGDSDAREERKPSLVILHTNDTHSHIEPEHGNDKSGHGGVLERAAFIDSVRTAEGPDRVMLLHAGDFNQGSAYYTTFGGELEVRLVNDLEYDCITLGNHEFDNGIDDLTERLRKINCPIVCANVDFSGLELSKYVKPSTILYKNGIKTGIIGLGAQMDGSLSKKIQDRIKPLDSIERTNTLADELRNKEHCDLVILLSHQGYGRDCEIAAASRNLDIIIGGHTHSFVDDFLYVKDLDGREIPIITDGCWGLNIGKISYYE